MLSLWTGLKVYHWVKELSLSQTANLEKTKLKGFAEDKFTVARNLISLYDWVENIVGKGENAGYQHFLLFPQCFQKASIPDP